jgi:hypothetical protein
MNRHRLLQLVQSSDQQGGNDLALLIDRQTGFVQVTEQGAQTAQLGIERVEVRHG